MNIFILHRLLLLSWILHITVNCDCIVFVRFIKYINPGGKGSNGQCCDGKGFFCQSNGCDHLFTVCLDTNDNPGMPAKCEYGRYQSKRIANQNINVFSTSFGGVANPMQFYLIDGPLPNATLKVNVYDQDRYITENDFVDYLEVSGMVPDAGKSVTLEIKSRTILTVSVTSKCVENYYGRRCAVFCPRPVSGMHYTCDPDTGDIICDNGWAGPNCTVMDTVFIDRSNADCDRLSTQGGVTRSGRHFIHVGHHDPFPAYCLINRDEGWTVILYRAQAGSNFSRSWVEYREGFGTLSTGKDFWLGLEKIYLITNQRGYKLKVILEVGRGASKRLEEAQYEEFRVEPEIDKFRLHTRNYSGSAGDSLSFMDFGGTRNHEGMSFSTHDRDNDMWPDNNCAKRSGCGWWFNDCHWALLTGRPGCTGTEQCLAWHTLGHHETIHSATMMLLPNPRF